MRGVLVVLDGIGDLPNKQLNDMTPLEAAETPNLDILASKSELGYMYPVRPGFVPESDEAIVSIFGNDLISSTRGQLEARGAGVKLTRGDLAFRANFATIDSLKNGNIIDRRAGRTLTTVEAEILSNALNKINMPCKFVFAPTIQHRGALVFRGGFSDNITGNDSTYSKGQPESAVKIGYCKPKDDEEDSQYAASIVNEFLRKAYDVLDKHPLNEERRKRGLMPANYLLVRGAGIEVPKLKIYRKWFSVAYMPLEKGFSKLCGMKIFSFNYPKLKNMDVYATLYAGLKKACKFSIKSLKKGRKSFDYAYIHIKETDLPGHDNKPIEKKTMIEYIDKTLFSFLRKFSVQNKVKVVVTADHSTPCKLREHSAHPVPVLFYDPSNKVKNEGKRFCEDEARKGKLGRVIGKELFSKVGFDRAVCTDSDGGWMSI
ncbi:alkaline phosphatase family protein, partial [Nanoarchaeota archaeon]